MGNCCTVDGTNNKEVNMQKSYQGAKGINTDKLFDNREVLGLTGIDKIHVIIKIQAVMRGALARRKVKHVYGFEAQFSRQNFWGQGMQANYDNPLVISIKQKLGGFNYEPTPKRDNVKRIHRELITLENGAKYEGEWDSEKNVRDGKG